MLARYRKAPFAISALTPAGRSWVSPFAIWDSRVRSSLAVIGWPAVRVAITNRPMVKAAMSGLEMYSDNSSEEEKSLVIGDFQENTPSKPNFPEASLNKNTRDPACLVRGSGVQPPSSLACRHVARPCFVFSVECGCE